MKPINQAERKSAFFNFLLIFIITIVIISLLVFFSVQVPFRENAQLRKQMAQVENERYFQKIFNDKMIAAMKGLDTVSTTQADPITDSKITGKLSEMSSMLSDSVAGEVLYKNVVQTLLELQRSKETLRNAYMQNDDANQTKLKMQAMQEALAQCQSLYNQEKQINQALQQH